MLSIKYQVSGLKTLGEIAGVGWLQADIGLKPQNKFVFIVCFHTFVG